MKKLFLFMLVAAVSCDKSYEGAGPLLPPVNSPTLPPLEDTISVNPPDTVSTLPPVEEPESYYFYAEVNGKVIDYTYSASQFPEDAPLWRKEQDFWSVYGGGSGCLDSDAYCYNFTLVLSDSVAFTKTAE